MNSKQKVRPVLTVSQLQLVTAWAKEKASPENPEAQQLYSYLLMFGMKFTAGIVKPVYTTKKQSVEESLGLDSFQTKHPREVAFDKWTLHPELCNAQDMILVQEHRFLNDLMTPEEEATYTEGLQK